MVVKHLKRQCVWSFERHWSRGFCGTIQAPTHCLETICFKKTDMSSGASASAAHLYELVPSGRVRQGGSSPLAPSAKTAGHPGSSGGNGSGQADHHPAKHWCVDQGQKPIAPQPEP